MIKWDFPIKIYIRGSLHELYFIVLTKEINHQTNKEDGCIIHSWRLSVVGLAHMNMNIKKRGIVMIDTSCLQNSFLIDNRY